MSANVPTSSRPGDNLTDGARTVGGDARMMLGADCRRRSE
eukprot:CAMPEP_0180265864 /NCGR_PEP_ID=MMETSP0988-20121125/694_1 /TAXON_ID=697907 /ORGANISM="non described non described, Strain CCMP2293" /LENGTH=39 /DNA_ID= /DNA_START= /DNA_END= /DNA_ORIENTATION=